MKKVPRKRMNKAGRQKGKAQRKLGFSAARIYHKLSKGRKGAGAPSHGNAKYNREAYGQNPQTAEHFREAQSY